MYSWGSSRWLKKFLIDLEFGYMGDFRHQTCDYSNKILGCCLGGLHVDFYKNCKFVPWTLNGYVFDVMVFRRQEHEDSYKIIWCSSEGLEADFSKP